jgi:hypothetical protein
MSALQVAGMAQAMARISALSWGGVSDPIEREEARSMRKAQEAEESRESYFVQRRYTISDC